MKKSIAACCAVAVAIATLGAMPASAASLQTYGGQFQNAQFSFEMGNDWHDDWEDDWDDDGGWFEDRGDSFFLNGHRGHKKWRPGWRHHKGFWFPPAAFSFSITIDDDHHPKFRLSVRHLAWCKDRYRSYRDWDNTFKPFHGPRRPCRSPWY